MTGVKGQDSGFKVLHLGRVVEVGAVGEMHRSVLVVYIHRPSLYRPT